MGELLNVTTFALKLRGEFNGYIHSTVISHPKALQCTLSAQCEPPVAAEKLTTVMEFFDLYLQNSQNAFYISVTVQTQLKLKYTLQLNVH